MNGMYDQLLCIRVFGVSMTKRRSCVNRLWAVLGVQPHENATGYIVCKK